MEPERVTDLPTRESPLVGVSTWALHHELGTPPINGADQDGSATTEAPSHAALTLLELPAELARRGFDHLQICHFHLPSRDPAYLAEVRDAVRSAGINLHALLVDAGDYTHPTDGARDAGWIAGWLPVAAALGAGEVRVIAGKTVDAGALARSAAALRDLATRAETFAVGVGTENWFDLLESPEAVLELLDRCEDRVRFLLDFGNWSGPEKYARLARVASRATSCHAQASFRADGHIVEDDFRACLRLPYSPGFRGPFILVNGGLPGIGPLRDFVVAASCDYAQGIGAGRSKVDSSDTGCPVAMPV